MMEIEKKLETFACRRCNECCKQPGFVYLTLEEAGETAAFLGMEVFDFVNQFCDLEDRRKLVLKKNQNESCVFLTDSGCRVHPAKPRQCRTFPLKWRTEASFQYCRGLKEFARLRDSNA